MEGLVGFVAIVTIVYFIWLYLRDPSKDNNSTIRKVLTHKAFCDHGAAVVETNLDEEYTKANGLDSSIKCMWICRNCGAKIYTHTEDPLCDKLNFKPAVPPYFKKNNTYNHDNDEHENLSEPVKPYVIHKYHFDFTHPKNQDTTQVDSLADNTKHQ